MKTLAKNKKAFYNYEILKKYEAGIVLSGQEVKSAKAGKMSIQGTYVIPKHNELFLVGASIPPYQPFNVPIEYEPEQDRKLLLKKDQIDHLIGKSKQKGLTLIPLRVYTKSGLIKVEIAVAKGKKKYAKKEKIKKREAERKIRRSLKRGRGDSTEI